MKRVWKKTLALVLALAMCAGLAAGAWAAESAREDVSAAVSAPAEEDTQSALSAQEDLPDVTADQNLVAGEECFVALGAETALALNRQPQSPARFVSQNPQVVSVQETGEAMVVRGESVGKAVVEMRRIADDALLDSVVVYAFCPSTTSQASGSREDPGDLTVTTGGTTRVYDLTCQKNQNGKSYKKYLSAHGCTICSVTSVCSAYGNSKVNVEWMMKDGLEEIALRSGTTKKDKTLGYYGMQKVLEYAGISSKVYNWKSTDTKKVEAAKLELVKSLSAGRPVMMFMDKVPNGGWENIVGTLFGDMHCITMVGINESGKLLIANSIYPQKISYFKYNNKVQTLNITPGEMLDYFVRHSSMKRETETDFYFTKKGGLHTFLEVTCDSANPPQRSSVEGLSAQLSQTKFTFTGASIAPKVVIDGLTEEQDFRVHYSDNVNAGTAMATIAGLGNYEGLSRLKFTIDQATGEVTAQNVTVEGKAVQQTVNLGASAKFGAKLSYKSDNGLVTVNSSGVVTIPAGFAGQAGITITSAKTDNYTSAAKKVTVTVTANDQTNGGVKAPAAPKLKSAKAKKKGKMTVSWKKTKGVTGYQVRYVGNGKTKTAYTKKTSITLKGLKKKKSYQVCVRSYTRTSSGTIWSGWSAKRTVKAK